MNTMLNTAIHYAKKKHAGQTRRSNGEPYVNHCIRVSNTVSMYTVDNGVVIAAVLHDTLEDTTATYEGLVKIFGISVADMVLHLTNDEEEMAKAGGKKEYLAKKINTLSADELLIKLADRLDNISDLGEDEKSQAYREQTRFVFLECLRTERLGTAHFLMIEKIRVIVGVAANTSGGSSESV